MNGEQKRGGPLKYLLALILFPLKVRKRYLRYNSVLFETEQEHKPTEAELRGYRENNIKLVNRFIHLPMGLFALGLAFMIYLNLGEIMSLTERALEVPKLSLLHAKQTQASLKRYAQNLEIAGKKINFRQFGIVLGASYILMFLGASILVINPAFKYEIKIKEALAYNRYFDANGQPWKVFWTPDAIIFHTYQCDSETFANNSKFWTTINFRPDTPVHFRSDANRILVPKAYALPAYISFEIKGAD